MGHLGLILAGLGRRKLRTTFTMSVVIGAFILFGFLMALARAMGMGVALAEADRLVVMHRTSPIEVLPYRYVGEIEAMPGVSRVSHRTWFGGYFREYGQQRPMWVVEPERFLALYPDLVMAAEQRRNWLERPAGIAVGKPVAAAFGWQAGDRVPLKSYVWSRKDGSDTWYFTVEAIFDSAEPGADTSQILMHFRYFDEARSFGNGSVGMIELAVTRPELADTIAGQIDTAYGNSPRPTRTSSLKGYLQSFAAQLGNINAIATAVLSIVFFTALLVTASTITHSFIERRTEIAVLKTLGFDDLRVLGLILTEGLLLVVGAGLLGLLIVAPLVEGIGAWVADIFPGLYFDSLDLAYGLLIALGIALVACAWPMWEAARLSIVQGLRART